MVGRKSIKAHMILRMVRTIMTNGSPEYNECSKMRMKVCVFSHVRVSCGEVLGTVFEDVLRLISSL